MSVRWFSLTGHFTSPGWEPMLRGRLGGLVRLSQRLAYMSPVARHCSQTKQGARTSHRFMLSTRGPHTRSLVAATTGGPPRMQGKQLSKVGADRHPPPPPAVSAPLKCWATGWERG